jgi:lipopolysaccharide export system permease protein
LEKALAATSDLRSKPKPGAKATQNGVKSSRHRRRSPLPIADGYVLRNVVESSLRGLGWFAGLFLAFAIVSSARRVAADDMPISFVLEMIALQMPRIILFTIPASLLFGTVSTFTEMSGKGEITALMAGGMSLWRMMRGSLIFAALMGVFAFWLQEVVVPGTESAKDDAVKGAAARMGVQEDFQLIDKDSSGGIERIVQAAAFDPSKKLLVKPVIQLYRPDKTVEREISAESARWDEPTQAWVFENGRILNNPKRSSSDSNSPFSLPTNFSELSLKTNVAPNPDRLTKKKRTTEDRLKNNNYEMVSMRDLDAYRQRLGVEARSQKGKAKNETLKRIRTITFGIHDKFATPLICIGMILIGAPLGIRPQRTASAGLAMGLSLLVVVSYYIIWTLATSWGKAGGQGPVIAAYLTFALFALTGIVMVARKS